MDWDEAKFDYISNALMNVDFPFDKKYKIRLTVSDKWIVSTSVGEPQLQVYYMDRDITEQIVKKYDGGVIRPTLENLVMLAEMIEHVEMKRAEGKGE